MADAPWRCTQCGTVNEPNANACRSCGRWPSLFDLDRGAVDVEPVDEEETFTRRAPAPEEFELPVEPVQPVQTVEPVETDSSGPPGQDWPGPEDPLNRPMQGWQRLGTWIVPIAFLVYVVISIVSNR